MYRTAQWPNVRLNVRPFTFSVFHWFGLWIVNESKTVKHFLFMRATAQIPLWREVRSTNRIKAVSLVDNWGRLDTNDKKTLKFSIPSRNYTRYRFKIAALNKVNNVNKPNYNNYLCGYDTLSGHIINIHVRKGYVSVNETMIYEKFMAKLKDFLTCGLRIYNFSHI